MILGYLLNNNDTFIEQVLVDLTSVFSLDLNHAKCFLLKIDFNLFVQVFKSRIFYYELIQINITKDGVVVRKLVIH